MPTFMYRGIKINCNQPLNHPDVRKSVHLAWGDLESLRRFNNSDVRILNRAQWRVGEIDGTPFINLNLPPVPQIAPPLPKPVFKDPLQRYVPAFHTFDSDKNFIGLTLCMSGKWGPPYKFIKCNIDEVLNFDDGLWNTSANAVRPDPEVYKDTRIHSMIYNGIEEIYYDLPATHNFCSYTTDLGDVRYYITWTGNSKDVDSAITGTDGLGNPIGYMYIEGNFTYQERIIPTPDSASRLVINTRWDIPDENLPYILSSPKSWSQILYGSFTMTAGDYIVRPISWFPLIEGWFDSATTSCLETEGLDRSFANDIKPNLASVLILNLRFFEERKSTLDYYEDDGYWGTFVGVTAKDGFALFINSHDDEYQSRECAYPFSNCNLEGYSTTLSKEEIIVFGKRYTLLSYPFYYWDWSNDSYIVDFYPRIYKTIEDTPDVALASLRRSGNKVYEYLCFKGDVEQYNDPDAMFPIVNSTWDQGYWHSIGDIEGYGNGEFSLVKVRTNVLPWPDASTINDKQDTDFINLTDNTANLDLS